MGDKAASKYAPLLEDPDVRRWLSNLARGSAITSEVALRRVSRASEILGSSPAEMVRAAKSNMKTFQDSLEDLVARLLGEGRSPGYVAGIVKAVKGWLRYNDITLTRRIKIGNVDATPTIENEQIPTQEELSRILRTSPARIRVAEALMAFADLRPETIGNHDGSDGLTVGDLPELQIKEGQVVFEKTPAMIVVRANLSKIRRRYFTFMPSEGCTYLKEYLEERLRSGEKLTVRTPLIGHERPREETKPFHQTRKLTHYIRTCMRKAGVYKRPYVLRAYAETQLIIAESKGKISHPYLQFIAGHKGDIEARYSTNKGRLPPDMVEDMRAAYKACEAYLSTIAQPLEQSSIVKEAKVEALKSLAKSLLDLDLVEVKVAKEKDLQRPLTRDEEIELFENEIKKMRDKADDPQMMIREAELESYLKDGWQFVSILPSQKILIRK